MRDAVAFVALALHGYELWTLFAQVLDHRVDVGVGATSAGRVAHEPSVDLPQLDLWKHFEDGAVSEVLARRRSLSGSMRGPAAGLSFCCVDRLGEARLHEIGQDFLADLRTELLPYHLESAPCPDGSP